MLIGQGLNHNQLLYKTHFTKQIALNAVGMTGVGTVLSKAHYIHTWSLQIYILKFEQGYLSSSVQNKHSIHSIILVAGKMIHSKFYHSLYYP